MKTAVALDGHLAADVEVQRHAVAPFVERQPHVGVSPADFRAFERFEKAIVDFHVEPVRAFSETFESDGVFLQNIHSVSKIEHKGIYF